MTDLAKRSAASRKGAATRKAMQASRRSKYGPEGSARGKQRHKVRSVAEILDRMKSGSSVAPLSPGADDAAGGEGPRNASPAREPEPVTSS